MPTEKERHCTEETKESVVNENAEHTDTAVEDDLREDMQMNNQEDLEII